MKKTALIIGSAPYGGRRARDSMEMVMALASFDLKPVLFFVGNGVLQLIKTQNAKAIEQKSMASFLKMLPLYDVTDINVCLNSAIRLGVTEDDMMLSVKMFDSEKLSCVLSPFSTVLYF